MIRYPLEELQVDLVDVRSKGSGADAAACFEASVAPRSLSSHR